MAIRIDRVDAGSEAEALGLAGGDELLSVDGNELNDTLDYDFYTDSKSCLLYTSHPQPEGGHLRPQA